ncbi:MAG: 23S rRNA (uracil(1939)-C(5))-methyltransferase RlmD [Deltaproteobacteria bacterium]|nr:23S rRNA (uracil(1939)-C(5))-methyltransferase RlmD [Deltaproteobacteria bacterium]
MPSHTISLTIDRLSYGPAGVGRLDGKVVFVPGTAPGDEIEVVIDEEKKGYAIGHIASVITPSVYRRTPPCPYVQQCGGCPWQHLAYSEQLRAKETLVHEQLRRIGGFAEIPLLSIIPAPQEWRYRHRIRLRVEQNVRVGFSPPRSHKLVEIDSCVIAWEGVAAHLRAVREWLASLHTPVRQVELSIGEPRAEETAQQLIFSGEIEGVLRRGDAQVCARFLTTHPQVAGLLLQGQAGRWQWGEPSLSLRVGQETLTVREGGFTQVNPGANQLLVDALVQLSGVQREHRVIELYCGAGNFSLPLARRARELIGIEQEGRAIANAQANAASAGVTNARFVRAAVQTGVQELLSRNIQGDIVILDPPRTGAAEVIDDLPRLGARTIVYVSCDPTTLARDLRRLHAHGYRLHIVQPLDMFPQSYHVETIAVSVLTC